MNRYIQNPVVYNTGAAWGEGDVWVMDLPWNLPVANDIDDNLNYNTCDKVNVFEWCITF
jgi:hypothetical protein